MLGSVETGRKFSEQRTQLVAEFRQVRQEKWQGMHGDGRLGE
jgi:hypothetical protein